MKLSFDTSVWVEHLRRGTLAPLLPRMRGRFQLWMDAMVVGELFAGCRSRREHKTIEALTRPFVRVERLRAASVDDMAEAGRALSTLRQRGVSLKSGALLDAAMAVGSIRLGATLVSANASDFDKLATVLPLRFVPWAEFASVVASERG